MSFSGETPHLAKILDDLTEQLDKFTMKRNTESIKKLVNTSFDLDIETLVKVLLSVKHINDNNLLQQGNRDAKVYLKHINKLILSKNNMQDADSHPVGQDLSIFSCATKSQSALNVKRLKINILDESISSSLSPFLSYILKDLGFKNDFIEPSLNDSSMHSNPITWFRVVMNCERNSMALLKTFKKMYETPLVKTALHDIYIVSEEFNIIELYYTKLSKKAQLLLYFESCPYISKIIFCSELGLLRKMKIRQCDRFSNMLKFHFCYKTKNIDFDLHSMKDLNMFHHIYLMCSVLIKPQPPAPLAAISYSKPMFKSQNNIKMVEPITGYEKKYLEINGNESIGNTSATIETLAENKRHCLHSAVQDRDRRILNGYSTIGGVNLNELIVHSDDETVKRRIELLREMS